MRAIGWLLVLTAPAYAQPSDAKSPQLKKPDVTLPDIVKEAQKGAIDFSAKGVDRAGSVGMFGDLAAGIVITPPDHPDSKPYPEGMVIAPPDPNDPMALELGTNQLRSREHITPWLPRDLSRSIKRGADAVWDFVLPKI